MPSSLKNICKEKQKHGLFRKKLTKNVPVKVKILNFTDKLQINYFKQFSIIKEKTNYRKGTKILKLKCVSTEAKYPKSSSVHVFCFSFLGGTCLRGRPA